ncbi:MAG: MBOAT family protein [Paludibacteraceae bacterium]|nr:MBOAT family protein [Paludibacteraceae bacterium]
MIFNSLTFLLFFIVVFLIYWFPLKYTTKGQNIFLLLASYFFYGYADWKMLPLLIVATLIFYYLGRAIAGAKSEKQGYWLTFVGVALGVGTLLYFKYFNFFIESFASLFNAVGLHANLHTFNIIMPLGISFFTFRLLSYIIDIYRGKGQPTDDIIAFGTYVAFFPCILSGPIDRPSFIKQLQAKRDFNYDQAVDGCRQILWGLFKKLVVADTCAVYVYSAWKDVAYANGSTLALAAILYACQLYADFSGYTDMAIGVGRLLGLRASENFKTPFLSYNIADFWRRWHITLTSWLTDYVFMPLNIKFRDLDKWGIALAAFLNMMLVGLWHGANLTYLAFGAYHGILFCLLILFGKDRVPKHATWYNRVIHVVLTGILCVIGWVIFRAPDMPTAFLYFKQLCSSSLFSVPAYHQGLLSLVSVISYPVLMLATEAYAAYGEIHPAKNIFRISWVRWGWYYVQVLAIWLVLTHRSIDFIYFQF